MNTLLSILLSVVLSAQIDSTQLWIGDQTGLHLEATTSGTEHVVFPLFDGQQVQDGIQIVEKGAVDTISGKDGRTVYRQDLVVTSFKDSLFYIQPLPFVVDGDTQYSNSLSLNVIQPFELDTTQAITDIKGVMRPKIWWWGILRWVLLALLAGALAAAGWWGYQQLLKRQKKAEQAPVDPETLRPCEEVALEKLDKIKAEKVWQQGEHKKYFSELTYVIREYIGRRYDVHSTEKTSDDTLQAMRPILTAADQKELYLKLEKMLRLADLVKFAKWSPAPDENEVSLTAAYAFVRDTTPKNAEATDADFSHTTPSQPTNPTVQSQPNDPTVQSQKTK